jgi:hypothetical protein
MKPMKAIELHIDYTRFLGHVLTAYEDIDGNLVVHTFIPKGSASRRLIGIFKIDASLSTVLWAKVLDDTDQDMFFNTLEDPLTGHYIMTGGTNPNSGSQGSGCDALLWLVDKNNGEILKSIDASVGNCERWIYSVLADGSLYAVGRWAVGSGTPDFKIALTKFTPDLQIDWVKYYIRPAGLAARSYPYDLAYHNDKLYILGSTDADGNSTTDVEMVIIETDLEGNALEINYYDIDRYIQELPIQIGFNNRGTIVGGIFNNSGNFENYIVQLNHSMDVAWSKQFEFDGSSQNSVDFWKVLSKRFRFHDNFTRVAGANRVGGNAFLTANLIDADGNFLDACLDGREILFDRRRDLSPGTYSITPQLFSAQRRVLDVTVEIQPISFNLNRTCPVELYRQSARTICQGETFTIESTLSSTADALLDGSLVAAIVLKLR